MRPRHAMLDRKMKSKIYKKKFSQRRNNFCGLPGIPISELENFNQVLHINKSRITKGSWKVLPKDSCEIYKERRRRQIERDQENERKEDYENLNKNQKPVRKPARKPKYSYRNRQRRRYRKQSLSCSCCTDSRASCACSSDTEM